MSNRATLQKMLQMMVERQDINAAEAKKASERFAYPDVTAHHVGPNFENIGSLKLSQLTPDHRVKALKEVRRFAGTNPYTEALDEAEALRFATEEAEAERIAADLAEELYGGGGLLPEGIETKYLILAIVMASAFLFWFFAYLTASTSS